MAGMRSPAQIPFDPAGDPEAYAKAFEINGLKGA